MNKGSTTTKGLSYPNDMIVEQLIHVQWLWLWCADFEKGEGVGWGGRGIIVGGRVEQEGGDGEVQKL